MTLDQLTELMTTRDLTHVQGVLQQHLHIDLNNIIRAEKEYQPHLHEVHNKRKRRNKIIKDEKGNIEKIVEVARLSLGLQKKIVLMAAAFLGKPEIDCVPSNPAEENLQQVITQICEANKLDYKFTELAKIVMSERHCAELWYTQDVDEAYWDGFPINSKFKLSMRLIANSLGDFLYPVFDQYQNMIAFGRGYRVREIIGNEVKMVEHFDLYTADLIYYSKKDNNVWVFSNEDGTAYTNEITGIKNIIGKIPVIYYQQPELEWQDVQQLIERLETKMSNHADTNDYFDSPIVFASGEIEGFADKGESGKVLTGKNDAKVSYITWDNAPASMKLEMDNLGHFIHSLSHTPDISFDNVKGLGKLSGIALKLLFMDAHLKAANKEPIFGEGIQRRLNLIKATIAVMDSSFKSALALKMKPKFTYFMPEDENAIVTTLNQAVEGGILSTASAVKQNPLVQDPEAEQEAIDKENAANQAQGLAMAKAANPAGMIPKPANPEPAYLGD